MDGFQLRQGQNHFEEAVYFLPLSSQSFGIILLVRKQPLEIMVKSWKISYEGVYF